METVTNISSETNLASILFQAHNLSVNSVRKEVFSSLKHNLSGVRFDAEEILNRKEISETDSPRFYEIFPWFLSDLIGLEKDITLEIAIDWLSMYFYINLLDDYLDDGIEMKANDFIGSSYLAQKGLLGLYKRICNTEYEATFHEALFLSAKYQLEDVLSQSTNQVNSPLKAKSAAGKNYILITCASAMASSKHRSHSIIEITKDLLLAIQYLDDLADFEDDYANENFTEILKEVADNGVLNDEGLTRQELIEKMFLSGSLGRVLMAIEVSVSRAIHLITENHLPISIQNPSSTYLLSLLYEVINLRDFLLLKKIEYIKSNGNNKKLIIEEIDRSIQKIYLHT